MLIRTLISVCLVAGLLLTSAGCTTVLGTNIATDSVAAATTPIEPLGRVHASVSAGQWLWAKEYDKYMYG